MSLTKYEGGLTPLSYSKGKTFKVENGDLVIDSKTKNPVFVEGADNIVQTITRALETSVLSNKFHPTLGLDIASYFNNKSSYPSEVQTEYLQLMCLNAIRTSTEFGSIVKEIKVERMLDRDRTGKITIFLSYSDLSMTSFDVLLEQNKGFQL